MSSLGSSQTPPPRQGSDQERWDKLEVLAVRKCEWNLIKRREAEQYARISAAFMDKATKTAAEGERYDPDVDQIFRLLEPPQHLMDQWRMELKHSVGDQVRDPAVLKLIDHHVKKKAAMYRVVSRETLLADTELSAKVDQINIDALEGQFVRQAALCRQLSAAEVERIVAGRAAITESGYHMTTSMTLAPSFASREKGSYDMHPI